MQEKQGGEIMRRKVFVLLPILLVFLFIFIAVSKVRSDEGYVGIETCKACHPDLYSGFVKSIHGKKAIPGSPINEEGCESCHGPGAQHVEKGGGKGTIFAFGKKESASVKESKCLACHEDMQGVENWNMSMHKTAGISCDMCHSIHMAKVQRDLLTEKEPYLCFGCHKDIRAQFNKQSHHPIKEEFVGRQAVKCSNCHNPMGTPNISKAMIRADSVNDLCYKCHADKRGPYAFEHPPVPEKCLYCHEIHGSNHTKLLVRKVPLLCQSCHDVAGHVSQPYTNLHSFTGPATSGKNRFFARSCLNCHGNIHGSSLSPAFYR
jgi:DmsE family decaheme c-type cytochrome